MEKMDHVPITDEVEDGRNCPIFGVKSGAPLIGLGILLILFALIPFFVIPGSLPDIIAVLFVGFGIFLIWTGFTK